MKSLRSIKKWLKKHKLLIVAITVTMVPVLWFANTKYHDWDNAQLIKGLARDFPVLVNEIEQATGLELEEKVNCSITQEKFSSGVKTCELSIAKRSEQALVDVAIDIVVSSNIPSSVTLSENSRVYEVKYMNKNSCQISTNETIYLTCITAVREANVDLARGVYLNQ